MTPETMRPRRHDETDTIEAIRHWAVGQQKYLRIWRNNRADARFGNRVVKCGIDGQADLSGILWPSGRRLEIECKAAKRGQSPAQINFQQMIESMGGLYVLARSVDDVRNALGGLVDG